MTDPIGTNPPDDVGAPVRDGPSGRRMEEAESRAARDMVRGCRANSAFMCEIVIHVRNFL